MYLLSDFDDRSRAEFRRAEFRGLERVMSKSMMGKLSSTPLAYRKKQKSRAIAKRRAALGVGGIRKPARGNNRLNMKGQRRLTQQGVKALKRSTNTARVEGNLAKLGVKGGAQAVRLQKQLNQATTGSLRSGQKVLKQLVQGWRKR